MVLFQASHFPGYGNFPEILLDLFYKSYLEGLRGVEKERVRWRVEELQGNGKVRVCVQ